MRDIFREGMKLSESLARLPWRAAREVIGGKSETLDRAADLGERLGTLPFRAAARILEVDELESGGEAPVAAPPAPQADDRPATQRAGGPARETEAKPAARHLPRVVVLGAGYAGLTCFLELQESLGRDHELLLVNGDEYHWFTTELHTYVAGEAEDTVRIKLSRVVARPRRLLVGRVALIHPEARAVELAGGQRISYDMLVFALGSDPEYYGLPGVAENSMIVGNWQSATRLRERIAELLAQGGLGVKRRVVVAGGGLTGVEVAAELAEQHPDELQLTILEAGPEIMAGFAPDLVETARHVLESRGIAIHTGNPIVRVEPRLIILKNGESMPFDLLVWSGGVRGSAILAKSGLETTHRGRGKVDAYLRAEHHDTIYLVGDSAAFIDPATGREVPPTGQAAVQMGRTAGRNIVRRLHGHEEEPFEPKLRGSFASLGRKEGVGQIGEEEYRGVPAMVIKNLIEAHHVWETGGGLLPLITRLLRAPQRYFQTRPQARQKRAKRPPAP
ncbi:MAG: dehydrogenase [Firmicutes bacterium]|nr:dehydrogenase [Bacillota bacterium]